jgi:hypothetical protein
MSNSRPATARRRGRLELVRGQGDARPFMHLVMNFLHRVDHHRRILFGGDLDLAEVAETIGMAAVEAASRTPEFIEKFGDYRAVIGIEGQRPVTAQSISQSTGIPRETVRRKLKLLVERGVIVEKTRGGYVFKPGFIQQPGNLDLVDRSMRDSLQFMNDCVKLGLVRWVDEGTD